MAKYTLDSNEVRFVRVAQPGDRGYNSSKGPQWIVETPGGSRQRITIPFGRIVVSREVFANSKRAKTGKTMDSGDPPQVFPAPSPPTHAEAQPGVTTRKTAKLRGTRKTVHA
jgi:hypothetical protein